MENTGHETHLLRFLLLPLNGEPLESCKIMFIPLKEENLEANRRGGVQTTGKKWRKNETVFYEVELKFMCVLVVFLVHFSIHHKLFIIIYHYFCSIFSRFDRIALLLLRFFSRRCSFCVHTQHIQLQHRVYTPSVFFVLRSATAQTVGKTKEKHYFRNRKFSTCLFVYLFLRQHTRKYLGAKQNTQR